MNSTRASRRHRRRALALLGCEPQVFTNERPVDVLLKGLNDRVRQEAPQINSFYVVSAMCSRTMSKYIVLGVQ